MEKNRLYQFNTTDDGLASNDVYALASDIQGRIWAATDAGISICAMPEKGKKQVQNLGVSNGLSDEIVTTLLSDLQGNVWAGTFGNGVFVLDLQGNGLAVKENDGYVTVRNNIQKKIKPEASTHFGLQSLINRYQFLGERPVKVEDDGAFFTVKVPIKI